MGRSFARERRLRRRLASEGTAPGLCPLTIFEMEDLTFAATGATRRALTAFTDAIDLPMAAVTTMPKETMAV